LKMRTFWQTLQNRSYRRGRWTHWPSKWGGWCGPNRSASRRLSAAWWWHRRGRAAPVVNASVSRVCVWTCARAK
jgi:hypothetical protein